MKLWGFLRFEMNAHKPFSLLWVLISKRIWDSKGMANSFGSYVSNRGESALLAGESKGDTLPWQWFPKAAALPWRVESNGGKCPPWQEESNETGGFVAHDFAGKV